MEHKESGNTILKLKHIFSLQQTAQTPKQQHSSSKCPYTTIQFSVMWAQPTLTSVLLHQNPTRGRHCLWATEQSRKFDLFKVFSNYSETRICSQDLVAHSRHPDTQMSPCVAPYGLLHAPASWGYGIWPDSRCTTCLTHYKLPVIQTCRGAPKSASQLPTVCLNPRGSTSEDAKVPTENNQHFILKITNVIYDRNKWK